MARGTASADLPLDDDRVPARLGLRMSTLGAVIGRLQANGGSCLRKQAGAFTEWFIQQGSSQSGIQRRIYESQVLRHDGERSEHRLGHCSKSRLLGRATHLQPIGVLS